MSPESDPITVEVFENALSSAADEMALVVMRSAYSPVVRDSMDYSTALCDREGQVVAQGLTLAVQLGTFPSIMRHIVETHADTARPGDIFISNDPYGAGGQHLPDIYVIKPVFVEGCLEGYAATMAHHSDVGGLTAGSVAVHAAEIYQEGLRLPLLKLYEEGEPNRTLFEILAKNTRLPVEVLGDVRAQVAACAIGERGLERLVLKYGSVAARRYMSELQDIAERLMRSAIRAIPDGTYSFEDHIDGYGETPEPMRIRARVDVDGDRLVIDLDAPPQVEAGLNCPVGLVYAACYCVVRQVVDISIPNCEGYMRPIEVRAPEGTIVNPVLPAACGARGVVGYRVYDAVMGALSQAAPDKVIAAGEGGPTLISIGGVTGDRRYVLTEVLVSSWGARMDQDGAEGISNPLANLSNQPIELIEADFPLEIGRYGLIPDSGGAGRFRGGLAAVREYRLLDGKAAMTLRSDRRNHRPYGFAEGEPGASSGNLINPGSMDETVLPPMPMEAVALRAGDVFRHASAGGGGVGDPLTREPSAVLEDVLDEKVTVAHAQAAYGVILVEGVVDEAATERERRRRRSGGGTPARLGG
jgi:N-methylhydantoinase B